jgi:ribonuclease Z
LTSRFHPQLVNEPFSDPALYIELMFEKRAILFDLGDLSGLSPRKLLRISDVFVSHMHMDHFSGFERLLRIVLGRKTTLRLYGPAGIIDAVGHKLAAYSWNLAEKYDTDLVLTATEITDDGGHRSVDFRFHARFRRENERIDREASDRLLVENGFSIRAAVLDHGIPCLAFALEERAHVNIWKNRVEEHGLQVGPWLRDLKDAILRDAPDDTPIRASWQDADGLVERTVPLGDLRGDVATVTTGAKIAYVVDAAPSEANIARILDLAGNATVLFIESAFLDEDLDRARDRRHLTARLAGEIAGRAGAERLVTFHYSPRYEGRGNALAAEAEDAYRRALAEQG